MAKSKKDRDRRAVLEQLRRDQRRAERRRTVVVISVCVVVGLIIIGLAAVPLIRQSRLTSGPLGSIGASTGSAGCQGVQTKKVTGSQNHQTEGTLIRYVKTPPAFGPHYPSPAPITTKFYTAANRPPFPVFVHNQEHGYSVLWYDDTIAKDKNQLAAVKAVAKKFDGSKPTDKLIAVPWTKDDGKAFPSGTHVALTHWSVGGDPAVAGKQQGVWQFCTKVSGQAVGTFTKDNPYTDSPEPGGA